MTLTASALAAIAAAYPGLPPEYLAYLRDAGAGEAASGRMLYSGPVSPQDILGENFERTDIVLLGDDFAGYCFGYDFTSSCYGEVSPDGTWQAWPPDRTLRHYVGP